METKYFDKRLADIGITREELNSDDQKTRYNARVKLKESYPNHLITIEFQGQKKLTRPVIVEGIEIFHEYHSQLPAKVGISPANQADRKRRFICFKDKPKQPKPKPVPVVVPDMKGELQKQIASEEPKKETVEKLSSEEAAEYLGISTSALSRLKLPSTKEGKKKYYSLAVLNAHKATKESK